MPKARMAKDQEMAATFFAAIRDNDLPAMERLLKQGAEIEGTLKEATPLICAAESGHPAAVTFLLDNGAQVDTTNHVRRTALSCAVCEQSPSGVVELLLSRGANPHAKDHMGDSVLMLAASKGNTRAIKLLLALDAAIDFRGNNNETPLIQAAFGGHAEAVVLLIERGADATLENVDGDDAKCAAAWAGSPTLVTLITKSVLAREQRLAAEQAEKAAEEFRQNLECIAGAMRGGSDVAVPVSRPLRLKGVACG